MRWPRGSCATPPRHAYLETAGPGPHGTAMLPEEGDVGS
jgi:hypothetical protein